jgi:hypothetical protein
VTEHCDGCRDGPEPCAYGALPAAQKLEDLGETEEIVEDEGDLNDSEYETEEEADDDDLAPLENEVGGHRPKFLPTNSKI